MNALERINIIFEWLANGGRVQVRRELKTNGGDVFVVDEVLRLAKLEPSLVDHSYVAVFQSERNGAKLIRVKETDLDSVEPL
jgi:hypothetical protein